MTNPTLSHYLAAHTPGYHSQPLQQAGGEGGIRTHEGITPLRALQARLFVHSSTSPDFSMEGLSCHPDVTLLGGEGGIRTHDSVKSTAFRVRWLSSHPVPSYLPTYSQLYIATEIVSVVMSRPVPSRGVCRQFGRQFASWLRHGVAVYTMTGHTSRCLFNGTVRTRENTRIVLQSHTTKRPERLRDVIRERM